MAFDFPASPTLNQIFTPAGGPTYVWNGTAWTVQPGLGTNFLSWPAGVGVDYWGSTAPAGSLFCYGQTVSRTTYAALFAAIGTTYNVGGEAGTDFRLPDCRGRALAGKDNMGGVSADRITVAFDGDVLGASGGTQNHTLTQAEMPAHAHGQQGTFTSANDNPDHTHAATPTGGGGPSSGFQGNTGGGPYGSLTTLGASTRHTHSVTLSGPTGDAGSGTAHNNVQPTIVCNKLITTGGV